LIVRCKQDSTDQDEQFAEEKQAQAFLTEAERLIAGEEQK